MFYIVPAGKSIDHIVTTTESFMAARFHVNFLKKTSDEDHDIVEMRRYKFNNVNDHTALHDGPAEKAIDHSLYM